jgi:iron complex transport system substrate-binding protein
MLIAVAQDNLFLIPADLIHRQSPRILEGAERVCAALEQARAKRKVLVDR